MHHFQMRNMAPSFQRVHTLKVFEPRIVGNQSERCRIITLIISLQSSFFIAMFHIVSHQINKIFPFLSGNNGTQLRLFSGNRLFGCDM